MSFLSKFRDWKSTGLHHTHPVVLKALDTELPSSADLFDVPLDEERRLRSCSHCLKEVGGRTLGTIATSILLAW